MDDSFKGLDGIYELERQIRAVLKHHDLYSTYPRMHHEGSVNPDIMM